jgi:hypothetical protein
VRWGGGSGQLDLMHAASAAGMAGSLPHGPRRRLAAYRDQARRSRIGAVRGGVVGAEADVVGAPLRVRVDSRVVHSGGSEWQGPREVLADPGLRVELEWEEHSNWRQGSGWRSAGHRPDLTTVSNVGLTLVEVDIPAKSSKRRIAVLKRYRDRISQGRIGGVLYVCATEAGRERIENEADSAYFNTRRLRTMLIGTVRARAFGDAA